ncbi:MAG: efflux RND transporter periplasmic adaptor subunit, partial [Elainella sp.]
MTCAFSPAVWLRLSHGFLLLFLLLPAAVSAHPGHGDHEFEAQGTAATPEAVQVDPVAAERMGIRVEPAAPQQFSLAIRTTGQIEALPNQQVKVTAPLTGTVVRLLIQPGERVQRGQ